MTRDALHGACSCADVKALLSSQRNITNAEKQVARHEGRVGGAEPTQLLVRLHARRGGGAKKKKTKRRRQWQGKIRLKD